MAATISMLARPTSSSKHGEIERIVPDGLLLKDGSVRQADVMVAATGYKNQQDVVRYFPGDEIADRIGPVWGFDEAGEMRNMWCRTAAWTLVCWRQPPSCANLFEVSRTADQGLRRWSAEPSPRNQSRTFDGKNSIAIAQQKRSTVHCRH